MWVDAHTLSTAGEDNVKEMQPSLSFPDQSDWTPEIPPTWADGSDVFHVTERCNRLRAIPKGKRLTSRIPPRALRQCFNCEDIMRAMRKG